MAPIEITADGENRIDGDMAMAEVNVVVRQGADVLYADRVTLDRKTKLVMASGNVRIYTAGKVYRGDTLFYNFETQKVESSEFRMSYLPSFVGGKKVTTPEDRHYHIESGSYTTDNRETPAYQFKAGTVEIYQDDSVVLKNVVLYVGKVPVLWFPIFVQSINDDRPNIISYGGNNSRYGTFALTTYNWYYDKNLRGALHFDVRTKRGLASGIDLDYKPTRDSKGLFRAYYAQDNSPETNVTGLPRQGVTDSRYRIALQQKTNYSQGLSTTIDLNIWSDAHITEDFFEKEFRDERQPDNFAEAVQYNENFTISLLARDQLNEFFETVERSPELKIESKRLKLYDNLEYQSEYSIANLRRTFAEPRTVENYGSYRWDTLQQLLYPRQYFNWLSFTPRAGVRGTAWSDDNRITPGNKQHTPQERVAEFIGAEASFKVSKTWSDVQNKRLGIDGLRHVAEPFINAQYVHEPNVTPDRIRGYDTRLPSTRLQPINYDQYNSLDSLDKQAVVRHGVRNKLQTKRDGLNWDLVDWAIYADADMARQQDLDPSRQVNDNLYSNVYSDLKYNPLPWLTFESFSSGDFNGNSFDLSDNSISWQLSRSFETTLGNRYLKDSTLFPDSNLFYLSNFYRMNEHWQFETLHTFEADDGTLQEQQYRIYRDLSSWQMALTFADRDNRNGKDEKLIYVTLTLKAFPSQKLSLNTP